MPTVVAPKVQLPYQPVIDAVPVPPPAARAPDAAAPAPVAEPPVPARAAGATVAGSRRMAQGQEAQRRAQLEAQTAPPEAQAVADIEADTSTMTEAQRFDHYRGLIEQHGGTFNDAPGHRNIVSLRTETDADENGGLGRYDDTTAMLWRDEAGNPHVREFASNTEPSARYRGRQGVDVNGDGRRDQGRMPAGYYEYRTGRSQRLGRVLRPTSDFRVERDTNQDGRFNDGRTSGGGNSMLFHAGGRNMTGSAGCQTLAPDDFNRFWSDLHADGNPGTVGYTLINR